MNAIHPIARTADTVTLRLADYQALISAVEDAEDIASLRSAEAHENAIGTAAARADHLSDDLVGRLLDGGPPLRIWREHRGLTAQALADAAGVSRSYLTEIETGQKPGSIAFFRAVAAALGVSLDDLMPVDIDPTPSSA